MDLERYDLSPDELDPEPIDSHTVWHDEWVLPWTDAWGICKEWVMSGTFKVKTFDGDVEDIELVQVEQIFSRATGQTMAMLGGIRTDTPYFPEAWRWGECPSPGPEATWHLLINSEAKLTKKEQAARIHSIVEEKYWEERLA